MVEQIWPAHVPPMCRPCAALIRRLTIIGVHKGGAPSRGSGDCLRIYRKKAVGMDHSPSGQNCFSNRLRRTWFTLGKRLLQDLLYRISERFLQG